MNIVGGQGVFDMYIGIRMRHPLWEARNRYVPGIIPEYSDYEGEVGPSPNYLPENEWFTLTEDSGNVRILSKDSVIRSWRITRSSTSPTVSASVRIFRGKKHYVVSLDPIGRFICNCTSFHYRKTCSHVKEVEECQPE